MVTVTINVHDLEEHAQIPILESEAEKDEGRVMVVQDTTNCVGDRRFAANNLHEEVDEICFGQNQRFAIIVVAEKMID